MVKYYLLFSVICILRYKQKKVEIHISLTDNINIFCA